MWCIGKIDAEYRERMYHLIKLYEKKYDPLNPVICFDEKSKQLIGHVKKPLRGKITREDCHYKRNGTRNIFMAVEPKAGKRTTEVTKHRKKSDFAKFIRKLTDEEYLHTEKLHLVMDNLNTHNKSSFYETFEKAEAERILNRVEFHLSPKHASWLNMAEIEIGIMDKQSINGRIPDERTLKRRVAIWTGQRNFERAKIRWTFTKEKADKKLSNHYI